MKHNPTPDPARRGEPPRALLIGDFTLPEFQPVAEQLTSMAETEVVADCDAAHNWLRKGGTPPELMVVAHLWPGQHPHQALVQLQKLAPLTRILALAGSWCEGEPRTGTPWPGMIRTYWHNWLAHWKRDFKRFSNAQLPSWGLPMTTTEDERILFVLQDTEPSQKLIAVRSGCPDLADMLCSACRGWGYGTVWLDPRHPPRIEGPAAILWEGNSAGLHDLHTVREFYPQTPILALIDFPRWEDTQQVALLGSAAVLSKPLNLQDLFSRLTDLLHKNKDAPNHWTRSIA